jgi:hypothetical protein
MSPRLSIIPAGAVTDPALEPRDLQVLCLLGRHTNDQGWCVRSQVKMAGELHCARSSVQRSLDRLYDAGWVMKKRRGAQEAEASQPSFSYAYRVILDRDDSSNDEAMHARRADDSVADEGVPTGGHPCPPVGTGAQPCVGTGAHPYVGTNNDPLERPLPNEEREMRARATDEFIRKFVAAWPTSAADSQRKIANAAADLTPEEQQAALAAIPRFLDYLKRCNRGRGTPAGWTYLGEKRWTLLDREAEASSSSAFVRLDPKTPECRAVLTACSLARATRPFPSSDGLLNYRGEITPQLLALAEAPPREQWLRLTDRQQIGAWGGFAERYVTTRRPPDFAEHDSDGAFLMAPWPWPPRKDGTLSEEATRGDEE